MTCANESVFAKEIQMMMFGLGDCQTPLLSTAVVIESIVRQQLTVLILKTEDVAELRGSPHIEIQDILFVLRKDKVKLKRLLQFIELKDTKMGMTRIMEEIDPVSGITLQNKRQKSRLDNAMRYLLSIGIDDVCSENLQDQAKMERLMRAEQIAQTLNDKSYLEFHKSRTCSFAVTRLNQGRLFEWLKISAGDSVNKLRKDTIDILVYLAKEVVAELIDYALLVRQDMTAVPGDLLSRAVDPLPTNPHDTYGHKQSQMEGPNPLTPEEIREVVRRFMSTLLCPFGTFTRNTYSPHHNRLLIN